MTLSDSMLAMGIHQPGGPDVLQPVSVPVPVPGHGQIILRLAYAGVNRPDALQCLAPTGVGGFGHRG
jgi:NADPH:quinone reductase